MIFVIRCLIFSCFQNHPSVCWLQPFDYLSSNLVVDSTDIDVFQKNYFEELRDQESSNYLIESTSSLSEKIPEDILTLSYDWGKLLFYICSSQSKTEWYFFSLFQWAGSFSFENWSSPSTIWFIVPSKKVSYIQQGELSINVMHDTMT